MSPSKNSEKILSFSPFYVEKHIKKLDWHLFSFSRKKNYKFYNCCKSTIRNLKNENFCIFEIFYQCVDEYVKKIPLPHLSTN